jgi:NAD(P)-dependent dehydrogenase (short-subunit alcohol dehydrogenase family)
MRGLHGRAALVTGGAQGIGRAVVERLGEEGVRVAFLDVDEARAAEVVAARPDAVFVPCDLRDAGALGDAVEAAIERLGGLDVLVNNAGVNAYFDAVEMTPDDWEQVFAIDLRAAWLCAKHALPALCRSGHGSIVNVASIHSRLTIRGMFPYAAAKSGLVGLTRSLALDYGDRNVRVNAICPGYTRTRLVQEWLETQPDPAAAEGVVHQSLPLGRMASPAEIAAFVAFLASDDASYVSGAELFADGGLSARFAS